MKFLRPFWEAIFKSIHTFGIVSMVVLTCIRFIIVLHANQTGNYQRIMWIFNFMILMPFLFLNKEGRKWIGFRKPKSSLWLFTSFFIGILFCIVSCLLVEALFNYEMSNWYVYLSRSFLISRNGMKSGDWAIYFLIYAFISMIFSPIGEELLYRGIVHESMALKWGHKTASFIDSMAFAFAHLAHFGIVCLAGQWTLLPLPALLWLISTFVLSKIFYFCKEKSDSIYGAILCHSGHNLAMMYYIFYYVL